MNTENTMIANLENIAETVKSDTIELLGEKSKNVDIIAKINEMIEKLNAMNVKPVKTKDRGPDSTREMTADDATRIMTGDLKDFNHKDAALELGLSYGQIYSARKGFTFKEIYKASKA